MEQIITETRPSVSVHNVTLAALGFLALSLFLAFPWIYWVQGRDLGALLIGNRPWRDLLLGAGAGMIFALLARIAFGRIPSLRRDLRTLQSALAFEHLSPLRKGVIALSAGVGEEILFRGALQYHLGLGLTSLLFGCMHPLSLAYVIYATIAGLLLGGLALSTQALMAPIVCHVTIDALLLWSLDGTGGQ